MEPAEGKHAKASARAAGRRFSPEAVGCQDEELVVRGNSCLDHVRHRHQQVPLDVLLVRESLVPPLVPGSRAVP